MEIFVGTSGWSYFHWKENFYPDGVNPDKWLEFYSQVFETVEINSTFYHTPSENTVQNWNKKVPKEFVFSVKASRYITHQKKLNDCAEAIDYFYKNVAHLKSKLGPILFQLPPSFQLNFERLKEFINLLKKKQRHVFEFRHDSWYIDEVYELLSKHNIALCITDLHGKQSPEVLTADFTYIRLHGPQRAYKGTYGKVGVNAWLKKIEKWSKEVSVYCYFDNDEKGYAVQDAKLLKNLIF